MILHGMQANKIYMQYRQRKINTHMHRRDHLQQCKAKYLWDGIDNFDMDI